MRYSPFKPHMMKAILTTFFSFLFVLSIAQSPASKNKLHSKSKRIDQFMSSIHKSGQFMGAVLVVEKGKIIYKNGFGYANVKTKEKFTPSTPCYIGSISKQFTAAGIVILREKGKLDYEQSIRNYFTSLPECYQQVTIRHLLQHSSGLALFDDFPGMRENDVFSILQKQTALRFTPGSKFEYCNANYTLLGMLIEKIVDQNLDHFLTSNVFVPCGMKNTYVDLPSVTNRKRATGYYLFGDEYNYSTYIGGAASVVSTVEDLYKWDQALYQPTIISKESLDEIFTAGKNNWDNREYGKQGYGFGWFVSGDETNRIVQHDGGFAGFRAYIERQINKRNSIIFVSNVRHELIGKIREGIVHIMNDETYEIPKTSAANWILARSKNIGIKQAISDYRSATKTKDSSNFYFSERECNSLGYYLLRNNKSIDAIELFKLNTEQFPSSGNVFDSLGEAYLKTGDNEKALACYRKAFELDPSNSNAADMIKKITEKK
jgi:CubicO group peptidase (beta-lactamase class C family)